MKSEDFLLYPLANEEQPNCPACGKPMAIALHETRLNRPTSRRISAPNASGRKNSFVSTDGHCFSDFERASFAAVIVRWRDQHRLISRPWTVEEVSRLEKLATRMTPAGVIAVKLGRTLGRPPRRHLPSGQGAALLRAARSAGPRHQGQHPPPAGISEDTAGSIMTTEFASVPSTYTVQQTLDYFRHVESSRETVSAIYVLDLLSKKLVKTITLRRLIAGDPFAASHSEWRRPPCDTTCPSYWSASKRAKSIRLSWSPIARRSKKDPSSTKTFRAKKDGCIKVVMKP
jgi:hypothetical protein